MRFLLLTIITLLPTYLIRFRIGAFPTTSLEILILFTFFYWCVEKIVKHAKARSGAVPLSGIDDPSGHGVPPGRDERGRRAVSRRAGAANEAKGDAPERAFFLPIILFVLASAISIFIAPNLRAALGLWRAYIVEPILFFFMMTDTIKRGWPTVWRDVTIALSLSALGVALPAIYQKFNPIGIPNIHWAAAETRRVTSWYGFPNAIGLYLAPIISLLIGYILGYKKSAGGDPRRGSPIEPQQSRDGGTMRSDGGVAWQDPERSLTWPQAIAIIATFASLLAILFARSEGALTALVIVGFVAGLATARTRLFTTVIALIFIIATFTNTPWRTYLYDQITLRREAGPVRLMQWKETARMLRDTSTPLGAGRPLFGAGLSGYPKTVAPYHTQKHIEIYQYPHNIILNFWSEMGLLGLLAFLWVIIIFFRQSIKKLPITHYPLRITLIAAMSVILIHGLVDVPYFKNDLAIFFWLLLALTFSANPSIVKKKE